VRAKDADHDIFMSNPDLVQKTIKRRSERHDLSRERSMPSC
jgi:hypothetical protein